MDVVIALRDQSKNNNDDLRYCIKSIEDNLIDLDKIFIVTAPDSCPKWLKNVIHVHCEDTLLRNKDANIINKVLAAIAMKVSDEFIRFSDDQILLKRIHSSDIKLYNSGNLKNKIVKKNSNWHNRLQNTVDKLQSDGKPAVNYESHIPCIYNAKLFQHVYTVLYPEYKTEDEGYTINTMYYNSIADIVSYPMAMDKITFERDTLLKAEEIISICKTKTWLGYSEKGRTPELVKALNIMFNKESNYIENENIVQLKANIDCNSVRLEYRDILLHTRAKLLNLYNELSDSTIINKDDKIAINKYKDIVLKQLTDIESNFTIFDLREYNEQWQNH